MIIIIIMRKTHSYSPVSFVVSILLSPILKLNGLEARKLGGGREDFLTRVLWI